MKSTIKSIIAATLLGISSLVGVARAGSLDSRVFYDTQESHARVEARASLDGNRVLVDSDGEDSRAGVDFANKNLNLNAGYQKIDGEDQTRAYGKFGGDTKLAGAYQSQGEKFWEAYLTTKADQSDLEFEINSKKHLIGVARNPINKDNSAALVGSISRDDGNYNRVAGAWAHSGKVGFLAYAIAGENEDGTQYRDFRVRGGLGNKTTSKSIGVISVNENCFFDEDTVSDITDPLFTGNFGNYAANVRGDPLGFDVRYKNDVFSGQVAARAGRFTLMPTYRNNLETHKEGFDLEAITSLEKGFYIRAQNRTNKDKKPEQAIMLGYGRKF